MGKSWKAVTIFRDAINQPISFVTTFPGLCGWIAKVLGVAFMRHIPFSLLIAVICTGTIIALILRILDLEETPFSTFRDFLEDRIKWCEPFTKEGCTDLDGYIKWQNDTYKGFATALGEDEARIFLWGGGYGGSYIRFENGQYNPDIRNDSNALNNCARQRIASLRDRLANTTNLEIHPTYTDSSHLKYYFGDSRERK